MTSIILVHTFSPVAGEHYTALPAEEGQPVSYVRRIVVEGWPDRALGIAADLLKEQEVAAGAYLVDAPKDEIFMSRRAAESLKKAEPKLATANPLHEGLDADNAFLERQLGAGEDMTEINDALTKGKQKWGQKSKP